MGWIDGGNQEDEFLPRTKLFKFEPIQRSEDVIKEEQTVSNGDIGTM